MQNVFERKTGKIYFVQYDFFLTEISKGLVKTSIMKCPKHKSKQRLKQESKHTLKRQDGRTQGQFIHYCQFQRTMLPAQQPAALAASPQTQPPLFQPLFWSQASQNPSYSNTMLKLREKTNARNGSHCWAEPICMHMLLCWVQGCTGEGSAYGSLLLATSVCILLFCFRSTCSSNHCRTL